MRLCRFRHHDRDQAGFYDEKFILSVAAAASAYTNATHEKLDLPTGDNLLDLLPGGKANAGAKKLAEWLARNQDGLPAAVKLPPEKVELLVPVPRPNKLFLLAGNYGDHIQEAGGIAPERKSTFPYVFLKPASTTLTNPGKPVVIPSSSPAHVDWELEQGVVIGRAGKHIAEADALSHVAGYTVINDISDRQFRPNPGRTERKNDAFFDWLHGKWHDSFCPCGPCITSADAIPDPQKMAMKLTLNGEVKQNGSTGQQIFPVAAVIEFISNICTLEPGDIISTGTLAGVGNTTGTFLKPGDQLAASIEGIGTLLSPVVAEKG